MLHRLEALPGRRRLNGLLAAILLGLGLAVSPAGAGTAYAAGDLRIAADATYTLDPGDGRVHVAVDFRVTNLKPGTQTTVFFYRDISFAIQPDARAVNASDANGPLSISTDPHRFYIGAEVRLRSNLFFRETAAFTVRYDLVGGAPRSESEIRVGRAFATFGVWAWGDEGRGSVEVRTPKGFGSQIDGSPMRRETTTSGQVLSATPSDPSEFYAIVSSENQAAYTSTRVSIEGGVEIVVKAWPEDDTWNETVSETLRDALPRLMDLIGLEWPVERDLDVRERYTPALEGYAGIFFTNEQRIDISEDLDPVIIVHEASHAWFDEALFTDRWVYEGLAEEYASRVLTELGRDPGLPAERPDPDDPGYIALNTWSFPEVIRDEETDDRERYGYQAAYWVMHGIVEQVGVDGLRAAFEGADRSLTAYPGGGPPEVVSRSDGWHRFLDLVEPIHEPDTDMIDELLRDYVLRDNDAADLVERDAAREAYRGLVATGDGWLPPWYVREPMGEWRFDLATTRIADAAEVLELRDRVDEAAAALGLDPGGALETAYEATTETFDGSRQLGERQLAALASLADADARLAGATDPLAQLGLIGETPRAPYDTARAAFERGDLDAAVAAAAVAAAAVTGAAAVGQQRLVMAVAVVVALCILMLVLGLVVRRRRRRLVAPALAIPAEPGVAVASAPSGTLATDPAAAPAQWSEPPPDVEGGPARGDSPADP
jgi:hypothetical protein